VTAPLGLAFKAYEIEELADVYFFRPLGMVFARAARAAGLTPIAVTWISAAVGVAGGMLLSVERLALLAFALIILYSVLDSSDGQLARMTGQVSELGRLLDGVVGYAVYVAIYVTILASAIGAGEDAFMVALALAAAASNVVQAQMYDYHRGSYIRYAITGMCPRPEVEARSTHGVIIRMYEAMQRVLSGRHRRVEAALEQRAIAGVVRDDDRRRYRDSFYRPVRGWNLLGDNTRFYAIGLLAWLHRLDWFFLFVLVPMNAAFLALWAWQARADRRFLAGL
jgi:phosphatidylglycerophosphate synthase